MPDPTLPKVDRLVMHIGVPKTGTRAIQESLAGAYDSLLASGTLYPHAGRDHLGKHAKFIEELAESGGPGTKVPSHFELPSYSAGVYPAGHARVRSRGLGRSATCFKFRNP
jgi:hypothetical protein